MMHLTKALRMAALGTALVLLLSACALWNRFDDSVSFYYRKAEFDYTGSSPVIGSEKREITGHRGDWNYLVSLYLMGPVDGNLKSPFPAGTRLVAVRREEDTLIVELTDTRSALTDSGLSLASACLTQTCMEFTDVTAVTLVSGSRSITTTGEELLLTDDLNLKGTSS